MDICVIINNIGDLIMNEQQYTIEEFIDSFKTAKGGYTKESLKLLGVDWPPPRGWRDDLIKWFKDQEQITQ